MENLTFLHMAWDTWKATRGGISAVTARQQRRLAELVAFVRANSRYYADKYRHITLNPEPCACGSILPSITVEGRNDDILSFVDSKGRRIPVTPMALWSVIEDTPGVYRFQAVQTAPERLEIRLQAKTAGEEVQVWESLKQCVQNYFEIHGLLNVQIVHSEIPPTPNPVSGKFRHVWADIRQSDNEKEERPVVLMGA